MSHKRNGEYQTPKDSWETPPWLFKLLDDEFHFGLDAAATKENSKCGPRYCDKIGNSLTINWNYHSQGMPVFLNPPYSAGNIDRFMQKAYEESQKGALVVCLIPVASDTRWWHNYAMRAQEIRFIKGRVKYIGYDEHGKQIKNSPTFASCVVIFRPTAAKYYVGGPEAFTPTIGKTIEQPKKVKE